MKNFKKTIQANLSGKVNEQSIQEAIKSAYRSFNVFDTEEEAIHYIATAYDVEPSKVMQLDNYTCELEGRVLDNQSLTIDGAEADYISTFKINLVSYSHDSGLDEEDYAFVINVSEL